MSYEELWDLENSGNPVINYEKVTIPHYEQLLENTKSCKVILPKYFLLDLNQINTRDPSKLSNIKFFWDGDCYKGFAKGLGRLVVLGDRYHSELIMNLSGDKSDDNAHFIKYDFIADSIYNVLSDGDFPKAYIIGEEINHQPIFNISRFISSIDEKGVRRGYLYQLLDQSSSLVWANENIIIKQINKSYDPNNPENGSYIEQLINPVTGQIKLQKEIYGDEGYIAYLADKSGNLVEPVYLDDLYQTRVQRKLNEVLHNRYELQVKTNELNLLKKAFTHKFCSKPGLLINYGKSSENICTFGNKYIGEYEKTISYMIEQTQIAIQNAKSAEEKKLLTERLERERMLESRYRKAKESMFSFIDILEFVFNIGIHFI